MGQLRGGGGLDRKTTLPSFINHWSDLNWTVAALHIHGAASKRALQKLHKLLLELFILPVSSLCGKTQEMSLKNRRKKLPRYLFDCHSTDTRLLMWTLAVCNPVWTLAKTCNNPACNSFWTTKLEHWNIQADCLLAISFYHCLRIQRLTWVWLMTPHLRVNLNPL